MHYIPLLLCLVSTLVAAPAVAQDTDAPARQKRTPSYSEEGAASCLRCHSGPDMRAVQSGPHFNLQNPGARAMGIGGAFISLADDSTAAQANPAGLTQLRDCLNR